MVSDGIGSHNETGTNAPNLSVRLSRWRCPVSRGYSLYAGEKTGLVRALNINESITLFKTSQSSRPTSQTT